MPGPMKPHELKFAAEFMDEYADRLGNDGCNDYHVENTDENWRMYLEACAWNLSTTVEEAEKHADTRERPAGGARIFIPNHFLAGFLAKRLAGEV